MFPAANEMQALLDLEPLGADVFLGSSPPSAKDQVYGGQAVAQALVAAQRTAPPDRPVHSLHAYFILKGDPKAPIAYAVERVRDGKSFTTRRCVATQHGRAIFSLEASFQAAEPGFEHALPMPEAPSPESLPAGAAVERLTSFLPASAQADFAHIPPIDLRIAPSSASLGARRLVWLRVIGRLPADQATHSAMLAYLSDMTLLETALLAHGRSLLDADLQVASLDHALWFHRPFRTDEWLLYVQDSPVASGARALTRGLFYSADGRLVASAVQEGLVRRKVAKN